MLAEVGLFLSSPKVGALATTLRGEGGAPRTKKFTQLVFTPPLPLPPLLKNHQTKQWW